MSTKRHPKLHPELTHLPFYIKENKIYINYFDAGIQAGFPSPADDFKELPLSLDEKYLDHPESTYLIKVNGNSMYPTLMMEDILIVKSHLNLEHNAIAILSVNNTEFTVKRFDKKKLLIADNPDFPNIQLNEEDTLICLGVVKNLIRDL